MNNKKSLIALALVALVGIVGATFAYFTSSTTLNNSFKTGTYATSVREEFVSPDNWTPGTVTQKKVNVTNNGSVEVAVRATYTEKWTAANGTTELSGIRDGESVAQFTVGEDWIRGVDGYYYYKESLSKGETSSDFISSVTFNPNFTLLETYVDAEGNTVKGDITCTETIEDGKTKVNCINENTGYSGATYILEITIETIQADKAWIYVEDSLYNKIASQSILDNQASEYVTSDSGISFESISSNTNGRGVYTIASTKETSYPIHYFRGNVTNNNVIFADYCWKIVRTTETGGIKLIYNGTPTNGKCNNTTAETTQLPSTRFNESSKSLSHVGYMYNKEYPYVRELATSLTGNILYGNSFKYENGKYTLVNTVSYSSWDDTYKNLSNHHYTCLNEIGECEEIKYISYAVSSKFNYITLTGGKSVENALDEMLWANDINEIDSLAKTEIDNWYAANMTGYTDYLEDTVWCSDRSVYSLGGLDPNGGEPYNSGLLVLSAYNRRTTKVPTLECANSLDRFTVNAKNGNGELTYPVGLLTSDEVFYAGGGKEDNSDYYLYNGGVYWTMTPSVYNAEGSLNLRVGDSGKLGGINVSYTGIGLRPSVSLKPGIGYTKGNGTQESPYVIKIDQN